MAKKKSRKTAGKKAAGKSSASKKSRASKKAPAKKTAPARPAPTGSSCQFVCSECYSEFMLPASFSEDTLSCPECLHVGKRPDDDFIKTVLLHKSKEKGSLMMAMVAALLFIVVTAYLIYQISPYAGDSEPAIPTVGLLGISGVLFLAVLGLAWKHESNRWEVYF